MNNNNLNSDNNTMDKLQEMMQNGDLNNIVSQIPPDMLKNFSNMMSNSSQTNNTSTNDTPDLGNLLGNMMNNSNSNSSNHSSPNGFDFSNIDMNTLLKMKSIIEKMNGSNDPRSNLLHSLKPYLRDEKKGKVDQYANLLNMTKLTELFNNQNNPNKGE